MNPDPFPEPDVITAGVSSEYQTNNGLAAYSVHQRGNRNGTVWDIRFSDKYAHSFRNAADGLVPGTQFRERAVSGKAGLNRLKYVGIRNPGRNITFKLEIPLTF